MVTYSPRAAAIFDVAPGGADHLDGPCVPRLHPDDRERAANSPSRRPSLNRCDYDIEYRILTSAGEKVGRRAWSRDLR